MSERPQISIVIPCYNQAAYLVDCLASVIEQTFTDWEAIVVDDCSDDAMGIADCVRSFRDPRIRLLRHEQNRGLGAARNTGFKSSRADLVLPLDSDDCLSPLYLSETGNALSSHPEVDCVFTDFQLFGESAEVWHYGVKKPEDMLVRQWIPGPGTLMRKEVWRIAGGYAELPQPLCGNEDWDFWISAMQHQVNAVHIPEALYLYRRTSSSMSVTTLQYYDYLTRKNIYERYRAYFDAHGAGSDFRAEGYWISATASLKRGKRARAAWLAMRGYLLAPGISQTWRITRLMMRSLCPDTLVRAYRQLMVSKRIAISSSK